MRDLRLLDNPIWNALSTEHACFARGNGLARCYRPEIGPLSGTADQSNAAYDALGDLARPSGLLGVFLLKAAVERKGWTLVRGGELTQMIYAHGDSLPQIHLQSDASLRRLSRADVPAMVQLAELTEPGPFRNRTSDLGAFFGIFASGRLLAMAGQRMRVPGFVEVSAVCTHPDARGRGYARALMVAVLREILEEGKTPFLHVLRENAAAIGVYEGLGFSERRRFHFAVLKRDA
jgi:predicted GNAT family acetyltransferase